jgi:ribosomal protein S18 acetylase RimI-like enzyme
MKHLIRQAVSAEDFAAARRLFEEYQAWLGVELCFQGFAAELDSLAVMYGPPRGRLLLAEGASMNGVRRDPFAGCIGLRPFDADRCEMKRLFVRADQQGSGLGRRLIETLLQEAKAIGYRRMLLDTLPQMQAAQHLYASFGFRDVEPYYRNPIPGARYLSLELAEGADRL